MASLSKTWRPCRLAAMGMLAMLFAAPAATADVINVDVTGVDPRFRDLFTGAEAFWESRIQNFSQELPSGFRQRLDPLQITATTGQIDGVGGAVGGATVTRFETWQSGSLFSPRNYAFPQEADMLFDLADLDGFDPTDPFSLTREDFFNTIIHEMGHAMGFGSLWIENEFLNEFTGDYDHDGHALSIFRQEADEPFAISVPVEQRGGPGSAGSHWSALHPFFNQLATTGRIETMTAFIFEDDGNGNFINGEDFVSETTWGAMADIGWEVEGINDDFNDLVITGGGGFPIKWGGPRNPFFFRQISNIPEPASGIALIGLIALVATKRRK